MSGFKKFAVCLLAFVLILSLLTGCNRDKDNGDGNDTDNGITFSEGITLPDEPDIELTLPKEEQPEIPDEELIGDIEIGDTDEPEFELPDGCDAVILLKSDTAEFSGKNVTVKSSGVYGTVVEITASGTYIVQGTLTQGFLAVAKKELTVTIILNGVNIYCANYAPIVCTKKSDVTIELSANSKNYLTDGSGYNFSYDTDHEPNACLYIRKDIRIEGDGALTVNGNNNNGIGTKAHLAIASGSISVNSINNALKGNDSINISGGDFKIISQDDGIKSDNIEDEGLGYINITGGVFEIVVGSDAVQSSTSLTVKDAEMVMRTEKVMGSTADSFKGLKADTALTVESGTFNINCYDDGIHSNGSVIIGGGTIKIFSDDDGIHADETLTINGGIIDISKSYEGLEAQDINLNGGIVRILASDDGINISGGADNSAAGQRPGGKPGTPSQTIKGALIVTGGSYYINSSGDGLDSNGNIIMSGGLVVVHGPTADMDAPIDYDGTFTISGGTIVAMGSANMAQQAGSASTQYSVLVKISSGIASGKIINLKTSAGEEIVTVATVKTIKSIVVSSPKLAKGSYTLSSGGTYSVAPDEFGIYSGGTYSGGSTLKTFSVSNIITTVN